MKISDLKAGMTDAATMLKDKNLNPFSRPLLVLIAVIAIAWFLHQGTSAQIADMRRKSEAQAAEVENREEYLKLKSKYVKLIEELPPNTQKSFWHPAQIISIREKLRLPEGELLNGNEIQTAEGVFTISTIPMRGELTFDQIGRVLEAIENNPSFLRISDLKISRKQGELGKLDVTFNVNTIFVEDKDFPTLVGGKK